MEGGKNVNLKGFHALPARLLLLTRRPPVCLNVISITDQLIHSISTHTLSHVHTQPKSAAVPIQLLKE